MLHRTSLSVVVAATALGCASSPEPAPEPEPITVVQVESEHFRYSMSLRRSGEPGPGVQCSYGRRTGSHFNQTYCRTTADAKMESDAAREFFLEAMRSKN